jgi:hypothetical protein
LDEVDKAVNSFAGVKQAATLVKKGHGTSQQLLVCYVTPKTVKEMELRSFISKRLPHYMMPSIFCFMDTLPTNVNGKTDRRKLQDLELESLEVADTPMTQMEQKLAKAWQQSVTLAENITAQSSFFGVGGDSLSVVKMTTIAQQLGFSFTVADVFQTPLLADLALMTGDGREVLEKDDGSLMVSESELDSILKATNLCLNAIDDIYCVTPLQQGMIVETMKDCTKYVISQSWEINQSQVSLASIKEAWMKLQQSYTVLRSRFISTHDGVYQVISHASIFMKPSNNP